jgi:hypothetical protein
MKAFPDFFDLPVYRLHEEQYYEQQRSYINERVEYAGGAEHDPDIIKQIREHARVTFGGPWQYNEIVGYIRLHFVGSQIRGEYFSPNARRATKTRKKVFWLQTHKLAPEISISFNPKSEEIFGIIKRYIDDCRKKLPRRYIDDSQLLRIGPFMDWKGLYESVLHHNVV